MKKARVLGFLSTIALLLVIAFIPMNAKAATFKAVTSGTTITMTRATNANDSNHYKITLKEDSLLALTYTNVSTWGNIEVYKDSKMENYIRYFYPEGSGKYYLALKKGTYYFDISDGSSSVAPTGTVKFSVVAATKINKDNYCRAKCVAVESYKVQKICQTPTYDYVRWYKFTIKSAKKVTLVTPEGYNSNFKIMSTNLQNYNLDLSGSTKLTTRDKLAAGTYYIYVYPCGSYREGVLGEYYTFKWK